MEKRNLADKVLQLLSDENTPVQLNLIAKKLKIKSDSRQYDDLKSTLNKLLDEQVISKSSRRRYYLYDWEQNNEFEGILHIEHNHGVIRSGSEKSPEIIIKTRDLNTALDGDTVQVRLLSAGDKRKLRGEVVRIIERCQAEFAGIVEYDGFFYFLVPDEEKYYIDFLVPVKKLKDAQPGDKVTGKFLEWKEQTKSPKAEITAILGRAGDPTAEFDSIMKEFGLPFEFPREIEESARKIRAGIPRKEISRRLDLRDEDIVTIDPEDAKDFDDAISLRVMENGNFLLGVHIADVSYYVPENTPLDIEARMRGTSVYLADRVVPMIPEKLSNELCSLQPDKDRMAYSVLLELTKRGILKHYEIHESIIRSKRRFTYSEVLGIIETGKGDHAEMLTMANKLAQILRQRRFKTGGIDFETYEIKFQLDENKKPVKAVVKEPNLATSLIEEFMLMANQTVAGHVKELSKKHREKNLLPFIYRIHEEPDPKVLRDALIFIRTFGHQSKLKDVTSKDINALLKQVEHMKEKYVVHQVLIRAMAKAIYSTTNPGHYGLGFDEYTHFTSPIRRYPDLAVHRLLKEYSQETIEEQRIKYLRIFLKDVARHSSETERTAVDAERQSVKLAGSVMTSSHVGEEYWGTISGVTNFGMFILLDDLWSEGLLHIRDMNDDFYVFDEKKYALIGNRRKTSYSIGKRIYVKIVKVSVEKRRIDLKMAKEK